MEELIQNKGLTLYIRRVTAVNCRNQVLNPKKLTGAAEVYL